MGEQRISLMYEDGEWLALADHAGSPDYDGSGPTPEGALYALAVSLYEELHAHPAEAPAQEEDR